MSGGEYNNPEGRFSSVLGGAYNTAGVSRPMSDDDGLEAKRYGSKGYRSPVLGGHLNAATGRFSSVSGGDKNNATGEFLSVLGGYNKTASEDIMIPSQSYNDRDES